MKKGNLYIYINNIKIYSHVKKVIQNNQIVILFINHYFHSYLDFYYNIYSIYLYLEFKLVQLFTLTIYLLFVFLINTNIFSLDENINLII